MSQPGQPLSIEELIHYIETNQRGTIDGEIVEKLRSMKSENLRMREYMGTRWCDLFDAGLGDNGKPLPAPPESVKVRGENRDISEFT